MKARGFTGWLFLGLVILALLVLSNQAQAQEDCTDPHSQCGHNDDSIVETVIGGDSTKVFGLGTGSLGAAAIGNCIATTQFSLFIIFKNQKVKLDTWCAAEYLDRQGKYLEAALMRCSDPVVNKIYGKQDCVGSMMIGEQEPELESALVGLYNQAAHYDERYEQQEEQKQQLEELAADYSVLLERIDRKDRVDAAVARKISRQKAEDNVYLRGLVNELKGLNRGESSGELAQADD